MSYRSTDLQTLTSCIGLSRDTCPLWPWHGMAALPIRYFLYFFIFFIWWHPQALGPRAVSVCVVVTGIDFPGSVGTWRSWLRWASAGAPRLLEFPASHLIPSNASSTYNSNVEEIVVNCKDRKIIRIQATVGCPGRSCPISRVWVSSGAAGAKKNLPALFSEHVSQSDGEYHWTWGVVIPFVVSIVDREYKNNVNVTI